MFQSSLICDSKHYYRKKNKDLIEEANPSIKYIKIKYCKWQTVKNCLLDGFANMVMSKGIHKKRKMIVFKKIVVVTNLLGLGEYI